MNNYNSSLAIMLRKQQKEYKAMEERNLVNTLSVKTANGYERAFLLDFDHPSGEWILVEFCLPVNGRKQHWVKKSNTQTAAFRNSLQHNTVMSQRNFHAVDYLDKHNFKIPADTLIDNFGFCYLTDEQEKHFWDKFKRSK